MPTREDTIFAAIAPLARAAGMVDDPDALKVLDISSIRVAVDGTVLPPHRYFDGVRRDKPHLFKNYRAPAVPKDFDARTASKNDYEASKRALVKHSGRR